MGTTSTVFKVFVTVIGHGTAAPDVVFLEAVPLLVAIASCCDKRLRGSWKVLLVNVVKSEGVIERALVLD